MGAPPPLPIDPGFRYGADFLVHVSEDGAVDSFIFLDGIENFSRRTNSPSSQRGIYGRPKKTTLYGQSENSVSMTMDVLVNGSGQAIILEAKKAGRGATVFLRIVEETDVDGDPVVYYDQQFVVGGGDYNPGDTDGPQQVTLELSELGAPIREVGTPYIL